MTPFTTESTSLQRDFVNVSYYSNFESAKTSIFVAIVYGVLYEKVFGVDNVKESVDMMLYGKTSPSAITIDEEKDFAEDLVDFIINLNEDEDEIKSPCVFGGCAPFPYKVAKALDPNIYRNIAYDTWTEMRRGTIIFYCFKNTFIALILAMRLGEWYHGDEKLILGTCCELKLENLTVKCYIQQFLKENDECVVYIPALAERKTVKYTELSPEADAKPWPLPYR